MLLHPRPEIAQLSLREILQLDPVRFAAVFKGTAVKRLKLRGLLRNACIVAANTRALECVPELLGLARDHAEPLVRAHAVWALRELGEIAQLDTLKSAEAAPEVLAEYNAAEVSD